MGAGKPGDIAYLTAIARPDVALVNNVAPAHLERMGTLLGIADTKGAIYDALPAGGVAVINADDAFAPYFAERAHGRHLIRFGLEANGRRQRARHRPRWRRRAVHAGHDRPGTSDIALVVARSPQRAQRARGGALALGAGAGCRRCTMGWRRASVAGRLVTHRLPAARPSIDDSYNANPGSLNAAIDTLAAPAGVSWLVLGDMRELGATRDACTPKPAVARKRRASRGCTRSATLSAAAAEAFGAGAAHFPTHAELAEAVRARMRRDVRVLVKGSRGSAMDKVVRALLDLRQGATRMLLELTRWLEQLQSHLRAVRLPHLPRHPRRADRAGAVAVVGPGVIRRLALFKGGQPIRSDGPQTHFSKAGTPTMGGALILLRCSASTLLWGDLRNRYVWIVLVVMVAFGAIGWYDDWLKLVKRDPQRA